MKPECTHCRERFSDYLDGLLAEPERQELDAHLAGCAECRRELDLWRATVQAVGELPRRGAPQGFGARVMQGLEAGGAQAPERPRVRSLWPRVMAVAAMLLVVIGAILIVQHSSAPGPSAGPVHLAERLNVPEAPAAPAASPAMPAPAVAVSASPAVPASTAVPALTAVPAAVAPADTAHAGAASSMAYAMRKPAEAEADEAARKGLPTSRGGTEAVANVAAEATAPEKGPRATADLKDQPTARTDVGRLVRDRSLVFQQTAARPDVTPPPHQVLTMRVKDPADLIRRAVAVANEQGLEVTLVLKPNDQADVSIQVPAERYDALVAALIDLTAPQSQALSNTALAQGPFYRQAVDNYRTLNSVRLEQQKEQAAGTTVAADALTEVARRTSAPEARRAAGTVAAVAAAPASSAPAGPAAGAVGRPVGGMGGGAPAAARSEEGQEVAATTPSPATAVQGRVVAKAASAKQVQEENKLDAGTSGFAAMAGLSAAAGPAAAAPAVVNLQISIEKEP